MNKLSRFSSLLLITLLCLNGCKKGENDPTISLKSRRARLTGEWIVDKYDRTRTRENDQERETTGVNHGDYSLNFFYESSFGPGEALTGTVNTHIFHFESDGTFRREFSYSFSEQHNPDLPQTTYTTNLTEIGTWQFLGATKDQKNKEYIAVELTKMNLNYVAVRDDITTYLEEGSHTFEGNYQIRKYRIDRLANKEIVLEAQSKTNITTSLPNNPLLVEISDNTETYELTR